MPKIREEEKKKKNPEKTPVPGKPGKKSAPPKTGASRTPGKISPPKPAAKKPAPKKPATKPPVKKTTSKPASKKPATKPPAKKTAPKKPAVKKTTKPALKRPAAKVLPESLPREIPAPTGPESPPIPPSRSLPDALPKNVRAAGEPFGPSVPATAAAKAPKKRKTEPGAREVAAMVCGAAKKHKIISPVLLNLTGISQVTDYFFVASAESSRQIKAVAEKILLSLKEEDIRPYGQEGLNSGDTRWGLLDFGDIIIHLFLPEARALYDLEGLWADAPRVDIGSLLASFGGEKP
ncbi:MAG: ribosome silencing factor [Deltaproteobacteria bacterium]|jgi:ribosome-associated protein|nr:ribosome silencing factor [Deltaproteobacteria bacterium]